MGLKTTTLVMPSHDRGDAAVVGAVVGSAAVGLLIRDEAVQDGVGAHVKELSKDSSNDIRKQTDGDKRDERVHATNTGVVVEGVQQEIRTKHSDRCGDELPKQQENVSDDVNVRNDQHISGDKVEALLAALPERLSEQRDLNVRQFRDVLDAALKTVDTASTHAHNGTDQGRLSSDFIQSLMKVLKHPANDRGNSDEGRAKRDGAKVVPKRVADGRTNRASKVLLTIHFHCKVPLGNGTGDDEVSHCDNEDSSPQGSNKVIRKCTLHCGVKMNFKLGDVPDIMSLEISACGNVGGDDCEPKEQEANDKELGEGKENNALEVQESFRGLSYHGDSHANAFSRRKDNADKNEVGDPAENADP